MKAGIWKINAAPLIFAGDGMLLDGAVRLHACLRADAPFRTLVVDGVDPQSFVTIDQVYRRSLNTILAIRREPESATLAAILRKLHLYYFNASDNYQHRASAPELLHMLEVRPELRQDARFARSSRGLLTACVAGALHHLGCRVSAAYTGQFFAVFNDEDCDDIAQPAALLRRTIARVSVEKRKFSGIWMLAVAIKAWNAGRIGQTLQSLNWRNRDPREALPTLVDLAPHDGEDMAGIAPRPNASFTGGELAASVEIISPEIARGLLSRNDRNRKLRAATVETYAQDMREGRWLFNGQTIKIGGDGRLLDGQHRCRAAVDSGCAFPAIVVRNIDTNVFDTVDLGMRRSFMQVLTSLGEPNACAVASAVRCLYLRGHGLGPNAFVGNADLLDFFWRHPEVRDHARRHKGVVNLVLERSVAIALRVVFAREHADKVDVFFDRLGDGIGLSADCPIRLLRQRLIEDRRSSA